jgi:hypothetical protein
VKRQTQYDLGVVEETITKIRREAKPDVGDRKTGELKAALRG